MKKIFKKPYFPLLILVLAIIALLCLLFWQIFTYTQAKDNLAIQQQWTSDKELFDRAYEISTSDKETPDKSLYIPDLTSQIGKTLDDLVNAIGSGAIIVSSSPVDDPSGAKTQTVINLGNEDSNQISGIPSVVAYTDDKGKIVKLSFSCNAKLLGYGSYSFVDLVDNVHIVENTIREAGLIIDDGAAIVPNDRLSYTKYASDGTTVTAESCNFSGSIYQNKHMYKWEANLTYDYSVANEKGNLAETIRIITITIS